MTIKIAKFANGPTYKYTGKRNVFAAWVVYNTRKKPVSFGFSINTNAAEKMALKRRNDLYKSHGARSISITEVTEIDESMTKEDAVRQLKFLSIEIKKISDKLSTVKSERDVYKNTLKLISHKQKLIDIIQSLEIIGIQSKIE